MERWCHPGHGPVLQWTALSSEHAPPHFGLPEKEGLNLQVWSPRASALGFSSAESSIFWKAILGAYAVRPNSESPFSSVIRPLAAGARQTFVRAWLA